MAKNFDITFRVLGSLDASLMNSLQAAADKVRNLSRLSQQLNPKAIASAQKLAQAEARLKDITGYKNLQRELQKTSQARAAEMLNSSRLISAREREQKQLSAMQKSFAQLQNYYRANKKNMSADDSFFMKGQISQARAEIKAQEKLIANLGKQYDQARSKADKLRETLNQQQAKLSQLSSTGGFGNLGAQETALRAQIQATTNALNQEIAALERRNQIHANFSAASQDLSNAYSNFQSAVQTAGTIMNPFTSSVDKAIEFEHTMSTLRSISQMDLIKAGNLSQAEENMERLTAQAKELGATTIYTAQQVGEAQVYIARTGWDTNAIEKSMPAILKLAAANRMDIESTADIVTNVMTAFGHGVDKIDEDTDVFDYTVTHSNQTLSQFGKAMEYAAPVAKLFGASIQEAAMMTKFMGDAGIQGSMAGTSMRQTMLRLTAPPKKASKAMDELGVSTSDATKAWNEAQEVAAAYGVTLDSTMGAGRQFISIMEQIDKGFEGKSDQEKLAAVSAITGINAVSGAANVFGAGANQARNFTELLENCRGALDQTYSTMTDDTFGAQKSFESAWEAIQLSMGETLLGITRAGYEFAAPLMTGLSQFIDEHPQAVQAAAAIAASVSAATVAVAGFSLAMAGVRFTQAGIATAGLMFGDMAAKITAASTALRGLTLANIGAGISGGISAAGAAFSRLGTSILAASRAAMAFVFTPVGAAVTALALAALYAYNNWEKISPAIDKLGNVFTGSLMPALEAASAAFGRLFEAFDFSGVISTIGAVANALGGGVVGALITLAGVAGTVISGIANLFLGLVTTLTDVSANLAEAWSKLIDKDFSGAFDSLKNAGTQAAADLKSTFSNTFDAITSGLKGTGAAVDLFVHPQVENPVAGASGGVGAIQAQIDTSQAQAQLDAAGAAAENAAAGLEGINAAATNVEGLNTAAQSAATTFPQLDAALQTTGTQVTETGTLAQAAGLNMQAAGDTALTSASSFDALSAAAGAVAAALQGKAAEIAAIVIRQPQIQTYTIPVGIPSQAQTHNAAGGIYRQGAFTTWFAEDSAEAAIPLDGSPRSIGLWAQAGNLLGLFDNKPSPLSFNPESNSYSAQMNSPVTVNLTINANNAQEYRREIDRTPAILRRSLAAEFAEMNHERARRSFA